MGGKTFPETSVDDLNSMLGQHVWTTFHLFQAFSPHLARKRLGTRDHHFALHGFEPACQSGASTPPPKPRRKIFVLTLAAELKSPV